MTLGALLGEEVAGQAAADVVVSGLDYDSRRVSPGWAFFAFPGDNVDGHRFIPSALEKGAAAVVSERAAEAGLAERWARVAHGRRALARAALGFYERPDQKVKLTGVTGTNGKTSTVFLIDAILRAAGNTTARIGTIDHRVGERVIDAVNTTPESLDLTRYFAELVEVGGTHATMEVSSHGLEIARVYGMDFHTAVFTNLTQDHLDFHGTMDAYAQAKQRLFAGAGGARPKFGVINADDPRAREFAAVGGFETLFFGQSSGAEVTGGPEHAGTGRLQFQAQTPVGPIAVDSGLRGRFHVANILAAMAAAISLDIPVASIERGIGECAGVPGRFESVDAGQDFLVVVDYAHTADALRNVLLSARELLEGDPRGGRLITLFGCGGDRDRTKRAPMGENAGKLSDDVILTSDNPRTEDPVRILEDAAVGLRGTGSRFVAEVDRRKAIEIALEKARSGDVVVLAGKGHEPYQQVGKEKIAFDDREVAREVLVSNATRGNQPDEVRD